MKKDKLNIGFGLISFLFGSLVCYVTLQFSLFEIDYEFKVVETLISLGTAVITLYIAITIQRKLTKTQNKYSFLEKKFDAIWITFSNYSQSILFKDFIEVSEVTKHTKEVLHSISFFINVEKTFGINTKCTTRLENGITDLESYIMNLPINSNIIELSGNKTELETKILEINKIFPDILREFQGL